MTSSSTLTAPVDIDRLMADIGCDRDFVISMLKDLEGDMGKHIDLLRKSIRDMDIENLKLSSHTIKGTLLTLRCLYVSQSAKNIEMIANGLLKGEKVEINMIPKYMEKLEKEYAYTLRYIKGL